MNAECYKALSAVEAIKCVRGLWRAEGRPGRQGAVDTAWSGKASLLGCLEGGSLCATQRARKSPSTAKGRETPSPEAECAWGPGGAKWPAWPQERCREGHFPPWNAKLM